MKINKKVRYYRADSLYKPFYMERQTANVQYIESRDPLYRHFYLVKQTVELNTQGVRVIANERYVCKHCFRVEYTSYTEYFTVCAFCDFAVHNKTCIVTMRWDMDGWHKFIAVCHDCVRGDL